MGAKTPNPQPNTLILGSQSPRRQEILSYFKLPFSVVSSDFDEEAIPFTGDPVKYAQILAQGKAEVLAARFSENIILTADTVVYKSGKIYGKPSSNEEAYSFLKELSGDWHQVFTAVHLIHPDGFLSGAEETKVLFNDLSEKQIISYYQSLPYGDKAGGYSIQGAGGVIVKRIEGCYYNVMGLPINTVHDFFLHIGIDLWNFLK